MITKYQSMLVKARINHLKELTAKPGSPASRNKKYRIPTATLEVYLSTCAVDEEGNPDSEVEEIILSHYTLTSKSTIRKLKIWLYETFLPLANNKKYQLSVRLL